MKESIKGKRQMRWVVRIIACFCIMIECNLISEAQQLTDTIKIKEVKITGEKKIEEAGMMVTHIDTLVMQMIKTQTVSELLSSYTPVFIKSYGRGSEATASFRGTAASHTQVYWNGMRVNSPMRGYVDFSMFPIYFIDDISLEHGGSSLQSGSGALGGSVLIENKPDWKDRFSVRYVQTLESFTTDKEYLNLGFGNGKWQFKTRVFSDRSKNDFPYYNVGVVDKHNDIQNNADYRKSGLLQEIYTRFGNQSLSAQLWAYQSDRNFPQLMSLEGDNYNQMQDDQNLRAIAKWKKIKQNSKFECVIGLNRSLYDYFWSAGIEDSLRINVNSKSKEESISNQIKFEWIPNENLSFNWSLNTDYNKVSTFEKEKKLGYDKDRLAFSLLNSTHIRLCPDWVASFLFRSEWYDGLLIGFIPSFGTEYWLDKEQFNSFKLNLSRNYHQPTLNDLYSIPSGNPNLKPEDGFSGDLAYAYKGKNENTSFSGQISTFASLIDDWIIWFPPINGGIYWETVNLKKVFARGAEVYGNVQVRRANGMVFNIKSNYSYTATSNMYAVSSVDESRGKQLIYIPKHKANIFAEADFQNYYLKLNAPFTGKRYITSNNVESPFETVLNPYWLVNMTIGKKFVWGPVLADASLGIENLLNTNYMAILYRAMPGRYYSITCQIQFKK